MEYDLRPQLFAISDSNSCSLQQATCFWGLHTVIPIVLCMRHQVHANPRRGRDHEMMQNAGYDWVTKHWLTAAGSTLRSYIQICSQWENAPGQHDFKFLDWKSTLRYAIVHRQHSLRISLPSSIHHQGRVFSIPSIPLPSQRWFAFIFALVSTSSRIAWLCMRGTRAFARNHSP